MGKWCAALSSVFHSGAPEGQLPGFNAKVLFATTSVETVSEIATFLKKEYRQHVPQYLKLQINAIKVSKC